jgi:hypothetical protein
LARQLGLLFITKSAQEEEKSAKPVAASAEPPAETADAEKPAEAADAEKLSDAADAEKPAEAADAEKPSEAAEAEKPVEAAEAEKSAETEETPTYYCTHCRVYVKSASELTSHLEASHQTFLENLFKLFPQVQCS